MVIFWYFMAKGMNVNVMLTSSKHTQFIKSTNIMLRDVGNRSNHAHRNSIESFMTKI